MYRKIHVYNRRYSIHRIKIVEQVEQVEKRVFAIYISKHTLNSKTKIFHEIVLKFIKRLQIFFDECY